MQLAGSNLAPYPVAAASGGTESSYEAVNNIMIDPNRVQVSEQNNIWMNLAEHSYRMGSLENTILGFGTQAEPLSVGQFGQFPVMVFTQEGISSMEQGNGNILYASMQPISKAICSNTKSIISIGGGIIFATKQGLKLLQGSAVVDIGESVKGKIPIYMLENDDFIDYTNNIFVVDGYKSLSVADFLQFINTAILAYDPEWEELIISNSTIESTFDDNYSYVFSFRTKQWTKRSEYWTAFVNTYPGYAGVLGTKLYDLSTEDTDSYPNVIIQSRPFMPGGSFTKIEKVFLRGTIQTKEDTHFGFLLFGSMNGNKYSLISGTTRNGFIMDPSVKRSGSSYKFYILVLVGQLSESELTHFDIQFTERFANRIR
mgnify:CR=1 FL=1